MEINLLTAQSVKRAGAGMHCDGRGLYLNVTSASARSWVLRYTFDGRQRYLGLGSAHDIPLARARELAEEARALRAKGIDPLEHRREQSGEHTVATTPAGLTFRQCAERFIAIHEPTWRNPVHRQQWKSTLATYAYPVLGDLPVQSVNTALVLGVLEPIWTEKNETASRLRSRIEAVLDWATPEHREGPNPAVWRVLRGKLPSRKQVRKMHPRRHHPALPYDEIAGFMADLRSRDSLSARALEFLILTAARTGDVVGATRGEINLAARAWTIPGSRMKAGKDHRVPLCARAIEIIRDLGEGDPAKLVFTIDGGPLSENTLGKMVQVMNPARIRAGLPLYVDPHQRNAAIVPHGFRSTFRDWVAEVSDFPRELAEAALAHTVGDETEAAYQRGDLFEKRRKLMDAWAAFCDGPSAGGVVVSLRGRALG